MYVPTDIICPILLKLKVKALIRCQWVCKEWHSIIQNPDFKLSYRGQRRVLAAVLSNSNLTYTSITNTSLHIKTLFQVRINTFQLLYDLYLWGTGVWCSCNGLVLFPVGQHILLWNPSTRCCAKVLEFPRFPIEVVSGLCYVSSTGDYKAVLLFRYSCTVMVASLKSKKWRKVPFPYKTYQGDAIVNFHDTLHWRVSGSIRRPMNQKIIYFEAESDEFKELPTPDESHIDLNRFFILGLGIIDDCLCMASEGDERGEKLQVWVMKEYGVKESWVCQFVISTSSSELFKSTVNPRIVATLYSSKCNTKVLFCRGDHGSCKIIVYDVKNNKVDNYISEESEYYDGVGICSYVESIVSPHEFIWTNDPHKPTENDVVLTFILERFNI